MTQNQCFREREREANWVMTDSRDPESVCLEREANWDNDGFP